MIKKKFIFFLITAGLFLSSFIPISFATQCGDEVPKNSSDLEQYQKDCEQKISDLKGQQKTLSSTIAYLNNKISLTQVQISKSQIELKNLEADIATLSGKINTLNISLDHLSSLLVKRIAATYKINSVNPLTLLFSSEGFSDFLNRLKYLRLTQRHDRRIIYATEQARANYDAQKSLKEQKQKEMEELNQRLIVQKSQLARQQVEKKQLLAETKNNEKNYQELLAKAVAELTAIQGIIAGRGQETKVRDINEGEKIASILTSGPNLYACSTGPHLHFEVAKDGSHQNPFSLLSSKSLNWENSDPPQNGSGSWNWPLNDPIRITQGYGQTSYSSIYAGGIHTGVDMVNDTNTDVKAVKRGTLYRGSISCRGGMLQYVRVDNTDDEFDTYYLHVNYF